MKKYVVDQSFLDANKDVAKECKLKIGDAISFDSREVQEEDGHTNPEDPKNPSKP